MLTDIQKITIALINLTSFIIIVLFSIFWIWDILSYQWQIILTAIIINLLTEVMKKIFVAYNETYLENKKSDYKEKSKFEKRLFEAMKNQNRNN